MYIARKMPKLLPALIIELSSNYFRTEHPGKVQNANVVRADASNVFREM